MAERVGRTNRPPSDAVVPGSAFTLLEIQVSAILAALAFAGLAMTLTIEVNQLRWVETRGYTAGTVTPFGVASVQGEVIPAGKSLSGVYFVDVQKIVSNGPGSITATLVRRAATDSDCGL